MGQQRQQGHALGHAVDGGAAGRVRGPLLERLWKGERRGLEAGDALGHLGRRVTDVDDGGR